MPVTILGVRHHGVGSAKNVLEILKKIKPDLVMVEGPPELEQVTKWIGQKDIKPPVAALCYDLDDPKRAVFYPFAEFSPEWQAMLWANQNKVPLRTLDLPLSITWEKIRAAEQSPVTELADNEEVEAPLTLDDFKPARRSPFAYFSEIAGYEDEDLWWEHHFEQKFLPESAAEHFEAVMLMMASLRQSGISSALDDENVFREAWMGNLIRQAQREMYDNIVVVCGAWHAPALLDLDKSEREHAKIVKSLPKSKIKVGATWIPWTNDRLAFESGYGAGLNAPGWYRHLWKHPADRNGARWLSRVAELFRKKKMDISTAHVIEAVRLAGSLASLRDLPRPGLREFGEATQTVMCMGDALLLELVRKDLIVGHALGKVPDDLPKLPLQIDFEKQCKDLKLPLTAEKKELKLDLRNTKNNLDLNRSIFLHRIGILGIEWGKTTSVRGKGTFAEAWQLHWKPEMMVSLLEMGIWGNSVEAATSKFLLHKVEETDSIATLSRLIDRAIPAELFPVIEQLLRRINDLAAVGSEILDLMAAVAPLASVGRYGNVRGTDMKAVSSLLEGLVARICIGLPNACYGLDEAASQLMFERIRQVHESVRLLENEAMTRDWLRAIGHLSKHTGLHPLLQGCACRLLFDSQHLDNEEIARQLSFALATSDPAFAAGWVEGFLKSSGMILLYDDVLWNLLHTWLGRLAPEAFTELLPVLRRTFSKFEVGERRKLGEKARLGLAPVGTSVPGKFIEKNFDENLAALGLSSALQLVNGLKSVQ